MDLLVDSSNTVEPQAYQDRFNPEFKSQKTVDQFLANVIAL